MNAFYALLSLKPRWLVGVVAILLAAAESPKIETRQLPFDGISYEIMSTFSSALRSRPLDSSAQS